MTDLLAINNERQQSSYGIVEKIKIALNSSQVLTLSLENFQIEKTSPLKMKPFTFLSQKPIQNSKSKISQIPR